MTDTWEIRQVPGTDRFYLQHTEKAWARSVETSREEATAWAAEANAKAPYCPTSLTGHPSGCRCR